MVTGLEGNCREKVPTTYRGDTKGSPPEEPKQTKSQQRTREHCHTRAAWTELCLWLRVLLEIPSEKGTGS